MSKAFPFERRVEFCETDAAGIAHFSSLIVYMEQAEHALLRSLGLSVASAHTSKPPSDSAVHYSWPRVKIECEFFAPAKFEDIVSVLTSVEKLGSKSIAFQHRMAIGSTPIATGKMTSVCCTYINGSLVGVLVPSNIRDLLSQFA